MTPSLKSFTLALRLSVPGQGNLEQILLIQATGVDSATSAFEVMFYSQDPLTWAVWCPGLTIREGVSRALLRRHFTSSAIHEFETRLASGGCMAFCWEYGRD